MDTDKYGDPIVCLQRMAQALEYYKNLGYKPISVPWFCSEEVFQATAPEGANPFRTKDKVLVGSAEQSFLQLMIEQNLPRGKYCAFSPCFRGDSEDELHQEHFYKVELINSENVSTVSLEILLHNAFNFYRQILPCDIYQPNSLEQKYDIVSSFCQIELGSYGIRYVGSSAGGLSFIYGTGCAEPRLSKVIELEGKFNDSICKTTKR